VWSFLDPQKRQEAFDAADNSLRPVRRPKTPLTATTVPMAPSPTLSELKTTVVVEAASRAIAWVFEGLTEKVNPRRGLKPM
jgi:hypothetical protein